MLRCVLLVLGSLACVCILVAQESVDEATLKAWQEKAEQGHADDMYRLGYYYSEMEYPDKEKAFQWFLKSAENGSVEGEYVVGMCYLTEDGVERNVKEGVKWLKIAARHRNPEAQFVLAEGHIVGVGDDLKKDTKEALRLLKQAAGRNNRDACHLLAMAYYLDCDWETADPDYKKRVIRLMINAANQDYCQAQYFLAGMYFTDGDETIAQDMKKAFYWMARLVEQDETLKHYIGSFHVFGHGCEVDVPPRD